MWTDKGKQAADLKKQKNMLNTLFLQILKSYTAWERQQNFPAPFPSHSSRTVH